MSSAHLPSQTPAIVLFSPSASRSSVPAGLEREFLAAYAADESPKFICECASAPTFRLFFDCDCAPLGAAAADDGDAVVERVISALQSALPARSRSRLRALVVGVRASPLGFHVKLPAFEVTREEARAARDALVAELAARDGCAGAAAGASVWARVIDASVYEHLTCRMLGARKATKGRDVGRVYHLLGVFGEGGRDRDAEAEYARDPVQLLADCSIRTEYTS